MRGNWGGGSDISDYTVSIPCVLFVVPDTNHVNDGVIFCRPVRGFHIIRCE